jgi:glycopeptide antibiotics resistance protein
LGVWIVLRGLRRKTGTWIVALQLVALIHLAAVVAFAFFPFPVQREIIQSGRVFQYEHNNLIPLRSLINALVTGTTPSVVDQSIGNLLLLLPLGVYLPLLMPMARRFLVTVLVGLGVSFAIEIGQLGISAILGYTYKIADVDDLILNTTGVAVGYGIYRVGSKWLIRLRPALAGTLGR